MKTLKLICAAAAAVMITFTARAAKTAKAVLEDYERTLRFVYDETNYGTKDRDWFSVAEAEAGDDAPWYSCHQSVTKVIFDISFQGYQPTRCASWFYNFSKLATVSGFKNLDVMLVEDFSHMFDGCGALESLDLNRGAYRFPSSSCVSFSKMFCGCGKLTSLDFSTFDTSSADDLMGMFEGCYSLTSLDLSSFRTSRVVDMMGMFQGCSVLTSLNLENFDMSKVEDTSYMFANCGNLKTITFEKDPVMPALVASSSMFLGCTALVGSMGTTFDAGKVDATMARLDGGKFDPGYFSGPLKSAKVLREDNGKTLRFVYDAVNITSYGDEASDLNLFKGRDDWKDSVTKVVFDPSFRAVRPESCSGWFIQFSRLKMVEGFENLNTSEVMDFSNMFLECSALTSVDLSGLDVGNCLGRSFCMFAGCSALVDFKLPSGLTAIDEGMFRGCSSLRSVTIPSWVSVIDDSAFGYCEGLETVLLPEGLEEIGNSAFMFCTSLRSITLPASLRTLSNWAFAGCENLRDISVSASNPNFTSVDGVVYDKAKRKLLAFLPGRTGSFSVPSGVVSLAGGVFTLSAIESVNLSADVSQLFDLSAGEMPAFLGATKLKSIGVDSGNSHYTSVDGVLYDKSMATLVCCPPMKSGVFRIPSSVSVIDYAAFSGCGNLSAVFIPKTVSVIREMAFFDLWDEGSCVSKFYVEKGDRERVEGLLKLAGRDTSKMTIVEGEPPESDDPGGPGPKPIPTLFDSVMPAAVTLTKAATYNGFLGERSLGGTFTLAVKKPARGTTSSKATLTKIDPATGKKVKTVGTVNLATGKGEGDLAGLVLNAKGLGGTFAGFKVQGAVDAGKAKDTETIDYLNTYNKTAYAFVLEDAAGERTMLTATFSKKGKVKIAGTVAGKKISGTACMSVGDRCAVPFVYAKKTASISFVLWFDKATKRLTDVSGFGDGVKVVACGLAETPALGAYKVALAKADVLAAVPDAIGATPLMVTTSFTGKKFDAGRAARVSFRNGLLTIDTSRGDNVSGLALMYSRGSLSGSFTVYSVDPVRGRLVKNKFTVSGLVIDGVGYAVGMNKKLPSIPVKLSK